MEYFSQNIILPTSRLGVLPPDKQFHVSAFISDFCFKRAE